MLFSACFSLPSLHNLRIFLVLLIVKYAAFRTFTHYIYFDDYFLLFFTAYKDFHPI